MIFVDGETVKESESEDDSFVSPYDECGGQAVYRVVWCALRSLQAQLVSRKLWVFSAQAHGNEIE